jgi:hypothetical protein
MASDVTINMNPGSFNAVAAGCTCPILDNAKGAGVPGLLGFFLVNDDCQIHGIKQEEKLRLVSTSDVLLKIDKHCPDVILMLESHWLQLKQHFLAGCDSGFTVPLGTPVEVFYDTRSMMGRAHLLGKSGKKVMVCE